MALVLFLVCNIFKKALPIFIVNIVVNERSVLSTEKYLAGYAMPWHVNSEYVWLVRQRMIFRFFLSGCNKCVVHVWRKREKEAVSVTSNPSVHQVSLVSVERDGRQVSASTGRLDYMWEADVTGATGTRFLDKKTTVPGGKTSPS